MKSSDALGLAMIAAVGLFTLGRRRKAEQRIDEAYLAEQCVLTPGMAWDDAEKECITVEEYRRRYG